MPHGVIHTAQEMRLLKSIILNDKTCVSVKYTSLCGSHLFVLITISLQPKVVKSDRDEDRELKDGTEIIPAEKSHWCSVGFGRLPVKHEYTLLSFSCGTAHLMDPLCAEGLLPAESMSCTWTYNIGPIFYYGLAVAITYNHTIDLFPVYQTKGCVCTWCKCNNKDYATNMR